MNRRAIMLAIGVVTIALLGDIAAQSASRGQLSKPAWLVALVASASLAEDPYHGQFCAGVLVAPDVVLTAAHCAVAREPAAIDAIVGADNLCRGGPIDGLRIAIASIETHPAFDLRTGAADLALLTLSTRAPGPVYGVGPATSGMTGFALGWGTDGPNGATSCHTTQTEVTFVAADECAPLLGPSTLTFDPTSMSCAKAAAADTCYGDSGGPVVQLGFGHVTLVGITSWGTACGGIGVYSRVDSWPPR